MKLPCEQALWYVLPQIRSDLAKELINGGLSQKEVAGLLGLTPSAVSQYAHKKRAGKFMMPPGYKDCITNAATIIKEKRDPEDVSKLICKCCAEFRSGGTGNKS